MKWFRKIKMMNPIKQGIICIIILVIVPSLYRFFIVGESSSILKDAYEKKERDVNTVAFDGEVEPEIPNWWKNTFSILGVDSNANGIRDDVEIWINRNHDDPNIRNALRQYARVLQSILSIGGNNPEESNKYFQMQYEAGLCLIGIYENAELDRLKSDELYELQKNSFIRQQAYAEAQNELSTAIGSRVLTNIEYVKIHCHFKVIQTKE